MAILSENTFEDGAFSVKIKLPSGTTTGRAGFVFAHDGNDTYYAVVLRKNSGTDTIELVKYVSGSGWGATIDSASATVTAGTEYTVTGWVRQRTVRYGISTQSTADSTYKSNTFFGVGQIGVVSDTTSATFDNL